MRHNRSGPRLLITAREGALFLERARIFVEDGRVVYYVSSDDDRREFNVPHVNLAVLFMGQGTSITNDAMRLLAEEGVHLVASGSGGTPLHMGSLTAYTSTRHFREMLPIYLETEKSLRAAKIIMKDRAVRMEKIGSELSMKNLKVRDTSALAKISRQMSAKMELAEDTEQLLGFEGQYAKLCYATFAKMSKFSDDGKFRRIAGVSGSSEKAKLSPDLKLVNSLIDHGNYLCYGIAGAALWALGIPPHMSIFHGKTRAGGLVFDLADSFKDALVLPLAFSATKTKNTSNAEQAFRGQLINVFDDKKILVECINTIERIISPVEKIPKNA